MMFGFRKNKKEYCKDFECSAMKAALYLDNRALKEENRQLKEQLSKLKADLEASLHNKFTVEFCELVDVNTKLKKEIKQLEAENERLKSTSASESIDYNFLYKTDEQLRNAANNFEELANYRLKIIEQLRREIEYIREQNQLNLASTIALKNKYYEENKQLKAQLSQQKCSSCNEDIYCLDCMEKKVKVCTKKAAEGWSNNHDTK
jgi:chromosome segregation ATPase